jgi:hypothetical protein
MCARAWNPAGAAGPSPTAEGERTMKRDEVTIGGNYSAKVGARTLDVRIDGENAKGGWNATAVDSGKPVRIKDARQLRGPAGAEGERTVEPADDAAPEGDGNLVPLTALDREKRKGGKAKRGAKGARAPKEKPAKTKTPKAPKEKKPKAMSALDAAAAVLKAKGEPMRCKEMVAEMKEKGLWSTTAPTPEATLYSAILRELAKGKDSRFKKTDRGYFALNK